MKQNRILLTAVLAADLILIFICLIGSIREDRVQPEFRFQTDEYIYTPGDREDRLLENITAHDDRDGDISDRIVIEKIIEKRESSTIVVYYAVSDSAGNVAKISRVFVADFGEQNNDMPESVEVSNGISADGEQITEEDAGAQEELNPSGEQADSEKEGGGEINGNEAVNGAEMQDQAQASEPAVQEIQPQAPQEDRSGYPVLTLRTEEVTIDAGTSPPWTEIIEILRDDKDDYATLYYNLSVSRFNRNQAGDYPVILYTEDSDGNRSDEVSVVVHVRG
ncbi:MAG: hypothetical protein NC392_06210 [Roseburia sp.]|nr:hypothetical protein [Roseburia sp.]MCM1202055.1 hypothetical protein [Bacteroides fragilis]